jgi:hypothetical protein
MTRFRRLREPLGAFLLYLLIAAVMTWPLVTELSTRLIGHPFSDTYEYLRHVWWFKYALQHGQSLFFQPLLAYPNGLDGAFLWGAPMQSFPAWLFAFVAPLPVAYNVAALLRLALNGWSAYWLTRYLTRRQAVAGLVAGAVFMAYPTMQGHLAAGHTGLLLLWPVALYAYALFRLRDDGRRRWIMLAAACFVLSLLGNVQQVVFTIAPITLLFVVALLWRRDWRSLGRMIVALILGGLIALIFALPPLLAELHAPQIRIQNGPVDYSADLLAVVTPSLYHPLFAGNALSSRVVGVDPFEGSAYVGLVAGLLALLGALRQKGARGWLALGVVAWICSLGPLLRLLGAPDLVRIENFDTYVTLPWLAAVNLPLINITRTPGRFNFTVALAVAVLSGYGVATLRDGLYRAKWLRPVLPVLMVLVVFEYQVWWAAPGVFPLPDMPTVPAIVPSAIADLAQRSDARAVFDLPWDHPLADKEAMWLQTGHEHPLIAGHITRQTPVDPAKLTILQQTLALSLLDAAGVDVVILHKDYDDAAGKTDAFTRAKLGKPFYEDRHFAVFNVPKPDSAPAFTVIAAPPDSVSDHASSYLYLPSAGSVDFSARLASDGRDVNLLADGQVIQRWNVGAAADFEAVVTFAAPGYHTLTLALDPPCPAHISPALECRAVDLLASPMIKPALSASLPQGER